MDIFYLEKFSSLPGLLDSGVGELMDCSQELGAEKGVVVEGVAVVT